MALDAFNAEVARQAAEDDKEGKSLSNCVNSGIRQIFILTQYKAHSLIQHVQRGWGYLHGELGEFIDIVPAQQQLGEIWYRGTADAVYQNLDIIEQHRPETVLVLAGDHVYKMDYGPMIAFHKESGRRHHDRRRPSAAVAGARVRRHVARRRSSGPELRREAEDPQPMPGREGVALASMGIYVINARISSRRRSQRDAAESAVETRLRPQRHSRGRRDRRVFAYPFEDVETKAQRYWRDVGTVDAYYSANMELIYVSPELNLYDEAWPIWTYQEQVPSAKFILDDDRRRGLAVNSMVAGGCIVSGAMVRESLLFSHVMVDEQTELRRSVVLPHVEIGRSCYIANAIIDEYCDIPHGMSIGRDREADERNFHVTENGVVLVTRSMLAALRRASQ